MTDIAMPGTVPDRPGLGTPQPGPDRPGFDGSETGPAGADPTTRDQAGRVIPDQTGTTGTGPAPRPAVPDQGRPADPDQGRPADPDQGRPADPDQAAGPNRPQQDGSTGAGPAGTAGTAGPVSPEQAVLGMPPPYQKTPAATPGDSAVPPSPAAPPVRSGTGTPAELFFEDLTPGRTFDLGVVRVDGDEMVAFARRFDPQWYHVDPDQAAASHHGGLIASGFYTVSLFMRAYVDHVLARAAADASPGLEELRWLAPVRAGDRLAVHLDVVGSRPSAARPGLGTVSLTGTMFRLGPDDQPDREVLRTRFRGWFTLRPT
ncbi:MaoC/PaaZ C-terminal domain-containing protein [Micromonospora rubida]|uniref:MaoC/PaaZ C-terminal domain-containing protein n=1 Tax=Micromonospora rubida TaxID=2697657 RepID=A0ABW7SGK4_9ACTN